MPAETSDRVETKAPAQGPAAWREPMADDVVICVEGLDKTFTLHAQGGVEIPVLRGAGFSVAAGRCLALIGSSGSGKSTLMRMLYGNYRPQGGRVALRQDGDWIDLVTAAPHEVLEVRRRTLGYVSQFLRVIPRVSTIAVVAEPAVAVGVAREAAEARAQELLARLRIPERLWPLSPLTFSGGEQQRVNIARGFIHPYPALLLDEPTASLDPTNRETVLSLAQEAKARGAALVGIFHDHEARDRLADAQLDVSAFAEGA